MAAINFGEHFSVDKYATREDVSNELELSNIDGIWRSDIQAYRDRFKEVTPLLDISGAPYNLFLTTLLHDREVLLNNKLEKLFEEASKLPLSSPSEYSARYKMRKVQLRRASKILNIASNEVALDNVINNQPLDPSCRPLKNYYSALRYFESNYRENPSEDLLGIYLSMLRGEDELTSFYRMGDYQDSTSAKAYRAMINREYNGMPAKYIEDMMNNLFAFLDDYHFTLGAKIAAVIYMFDYIKPFSDNNELVSLFLVKHLLKDTVASRFVNLIPLEGILVNEPNRLKMLFKEVQKSRDLTYILDFVLDNLTKSIQEVIDTIVRLEVKLGEKELYMGTDEKKIEEEFGTPAKRVTIYTEKTEEDEVKEAVKEEKFIERSKPQPRKVVEPTIEPKLPKEKAQDERALNRLAKDLPEEDPYLSPKQAHFYVRHNTVGKFYTIQQFKKFEGVVYETARTSMDNLAKRGYYRREQVKNKFVYTPIER